MDLTYLAGGDIDLLRCLIGDFELDFLLLDPFLDSGCSSESESSKIRYFLLVISVSGTLDSTNDSFCWGFVVSIASLGSSFA